MKISRMFKKLSAKKLASAAIVALAIAFPAVSIAAQTVKLESSLGVANVTAGDTAYKQSVNAGYDQVVKLQVYYHNTELPDSGKVADNLTVKINIPSGAGAVQTVSSRVSADNANTVTSTATINLAGTGAYLQYIPGSANWKHNTGTNDNVHYVETPISDAVVTSGAGLRLENEKPCFNYSATVNVLARVMIPAVQVTKQVQKATESGKWAKTNTADPGDVLKYMISYKNNGNTTENNVVIRDSLPTSMTLVPNTTVLTNSTNKNGVLITSNNITHGGIVIGSGYQPGSTAYIVFQVKLPAADALPCGVTKFTNVGVAQPQGMNEYYDSAVTTVTKVCANTPSYACTALNVTKVGGRQVTLGVTYTATNGATFKNVSYEFGDGTAPLVTDKTSSVLHTYAKDGEYALVATVRFNVNGSDTTSACEAKVVFTTPGTPGTPTTLVNTGAGDVVGLFAATTAAGAVAHQVVSRRSRRN